MHKSTLETHSLDGASRIVTMAERLADEEMDALKMEKPNAIPGESPAWNVAYAAGNEARRIANLQKAAADTVSMRRDELEGALSPLVSFKSIMHAAGQCSQEGKAPQSQKKGRCRFWRESDINAFIAGKWKPTQRENQTKPASFGGAR